MGENQMNYTIQQLDAEPNWDRIPFVEVNTRPWGGEYLPRITAQLVLVRGQYFFARMECWETSPRAVQTEPNSSIYEDSCMEFFVNFKPEQPESGYLNLEANANGALCSAYGTSGAGRKYLCDTGLPMPEAFAKVLEDRWVCEFKIPLALIKGLYGDDSFQTGDVLKGNFFKCGDKTEIPHFITWAPNKNPTPAFHLPEYFGILTVG